jgi:cytidylate kinase
MSPLLIAIDGTAGAGKGTLACRLAQIYNLAHLDTGLLYRALGLAVLQKNLDPSDPQSAIQVAKSLGTLDLQNPALRNEEVGTAASHVAAIPEVRAMLLDFQHQFAKHPPQGKQGCVMDGRDIGRVVLPEAQCKIYVIASPEVRAERRWKELREKGIDSIYDYILADIKDRDVRDQTRKTSPLCPAEGAFVLDTSHMSIEDVVKKACEYVNAKTTQS